MKRRESKQGREILGAITWRKKEKIGLGRVNRRGGIINSVDKREGRNEAEEEDEGE